MNHPDGGHASPAAIAVEACAQCGKILTPDDRVASGDRVFCRSCYASLRAQLEAAVAEMSSDINYANASIGAVLGGAAGALLWWGFTVVTHLSLGLIAIAIGYLSGLGAVRFAGGKRSVGLQAISIVVALASWVVATFLVNMTFVNQELAKQGEAFRVEFPPRSLELFGKVLSLGFGMMDVVFLAIVVYEAWKIPRPLRMPPGASS